MNGQSVLDAPPPPPDARVQYGSDANQIGDLFLPKGAALHPAVMCIHGGYWRAKYDRQYQSHFCRALANAGIAALNLEYRRVGDPGGGWPGSFEDVLAAWSKLTQLGAQYKLDMHHTAVCGHSAGGELAMVLAYRIAPKLRGVVSLAGVLDLQYAYDHHLSNDAVVEFLGGTPQQVPEHYAEADPMRLKIGIPQAIFQGDDDDAVPAELARLYVDVKKKQGEKLAFDHPRQAGHFDWIDPQTEQCKRVIAKIASLVKA